MYTQYLEEIELEKPATDEMILKQNLPKKLPKEYLDLLKYTNGFEGSMGEGYIRINKVEDLIEVNNSCGIKDFSSDLFIIGSDGGGEAFAIDLRSEKVKYILIPWIFEEEAIIFQGNTMEELFKRIYNDELFKR